MQIPTMRYVAPFNPGPKVQLLMFTGDSAQDANLQISAHDEEFLEVAAEPSFHSGPPLLHPTIYQVSTGACLSASLLMSLQSLF